MEKRDGRRMQRGRSKTKGKLPEVDAIAVALTAQIIICVLVLLAAQITRMASEERYALLKEEYAALVSGSAGAGLPDYFAELAGLTGNALGALEGFISGLMGRAPPTQHTPPEPQLAMGGGSGVLGNYQLSAVNCQLSMRPAPQCSTLAPYFLSRSLHPPVAGVITSPFAFRADPFNGNVDFHRGVDIAAPTGHEIFAALPGRVERVGECAVYGKYVLLRHAHNLGTFYAHASQVLVSYGARVAQGERIAKVGATGRATGPHLHFAVIVEGLYADPLHGLERHIRNVA